MNFILINSCSNNPFIALYFNLELIKSAIPLSDEPHNKRPDKLIFQLKYILEKSGIKTENLDAISAVTGPGSFTGIRIGLAIAKGLAFRMDKPIIPITNFELTLNRINKILPGKKYCVLIPAKTPEYYYSVVKDSSELIKSCGQINDLASTIDTETMIVGDFDNESELNLTYFNFINVKKFKSEIDSMLEITISRFEQGSMFASGDIEALYIKDFNIKKQK